MTEYIFAQDGQIVDEKIIKEFELDVKEKEIMYSDGNLIYDFVGFVYKKDKILVVFPKHYNDNFKKINDKDIELLFKVIRQYNIDSNTAHAEKYFGYKNNFISDYPFEAFYQIYDYYIKYGLYKNNVVRDKANIGTKISWKTTVRKSNIIISNNNILYSPLYSKYEEEKNTFIGECMAYIINHTIDLFPFMRGMRHVNAMSNSIDLVKNRESVLRELYIYRSRLFKDSEIKLIDAIITYLKEIKNISNGGSMHIKVKYFNVIWQKMLNKYLNEYFEYVDGQNRELIFSKEKGYKNSFKEESMPIDIRFENKNKIEPDFYFENENLVYVFDAKYYSNLNNIEYKQVAYTLLLGNRESKGEKDIYSALLLPGIKPNGVHILLNDEFKQRKDGCNYIIEQYLDVEMIMKNYINMK